MARSESFHLIICRGSKVSSPKQSEVEVLTHRLKKSTLYLLTILTFQKNGKRRHICPCALECTNLGSEILLYDRDIQKQNY